MLGETALISPRSNRGSKWLSLEGFRCPVTCYYSNESYRTVLSCVTIYCTVQVDYTDLKVYGLNPKV